MAELRRNRFKAAIARMELQRGIWCTMRDPLGTEMLASLGYDWMLFDTEHSPTDVIGTLPLLQAVAPYPVEPIVRPTHLSAPEIKKILDLGAQTLLIPYVQNEHEAAEAVAAITYPPRGIRGVSGMSRATGFAAIPGYHKIAHEQLCLLVQVETGEAVERIEAIAKVPGIDGIFIGPADLAASLGFPGEPNHPEVRKACCDAIRRIRAAGKPPGILAVAPELHAEALEAGAVFVSRDIDITAMKKGLAK